MKNFSNEPIPEEDRSNSAIQEPSSFRDESGGKLDTLLNAQKTTNILSLSDRFIGDEGAIKLAAFLDEQRHFASLELRGNNLTSTGFAKICESLKKCSNLRSLHLEWNSIGAGSNDGIQALLSVVREVKTLTTIDLRNNGITSAAATPLAAIIREAENLQTLDLRWNEVTNDGAEVILNAMKDSSRKVFVDFSGNRVSDDLLFQINSLNTKQILIRSTDDPVTTYLSDRTKPTTSYMKSPTIGNYGSPIEITEYPSPAYGDIRGVTPYSHSSVQQERPCLYSNVTDQRSERPFLYSVQSGAPYSQNIPDNFQSRSLRHSPGQNIRSSPPKTSHDLKSSHDYTSLINRAYSSLNVAKEEQRDPLKDASDKFKKEELEYKLLQANDEIRKKEVLISDLATKIQVLTQEVQNRNHENDEVYEAAERIRNEYKNKIRDIQAENEEKVADLMGQLAALRHEVERLSAHHVREIKEINQSWEGKLGAADDKIAALARELDDKDQQIKIGATVLDQARRELEEKVRRVELEVREDEERRHRHSLRILEDNLRAAELQRDEYIRKSDGLMVDVQNIERRFNDEKNKFEMERSRMRADYDRMRNELNQLLTENEKYKNDLFTKENALRLLERDHQNLQRELNRTKEMHREEVDRMKFEHNVEKRRWNDDFKHLENTLKETERKNRDLEGDLQRRTGREGLQELLTSNIQRVLGKTFGENELTSPATNVGKFYDYASASGKKEFSYR